MNIDEIIWLSRSQALALIVIHKLEICLIARLDPLLRVNKWPNVILVILNINTYGFIK